VNLGFNPGLPVNAVWSNTAGTLTGTLTNANTLTAPERATNLTVNATILGETCSIDFNVLEPTGIDSASFLEYWNYSSQTYAGAGVHFRPFIGPTNVSFYAVQIKEVGEDATNVTGYFLFHAPPSHIGNGADAWISLDYDNHWLGDYDWAKSSGWPPPWSGAGPPGFSGGSYTWNIPAKWRVNGGSEHEMKGWNQVHTLLGNGTMTVSKFGHSVSRTIQNQYSGQ
jgi:hypothetical protein